MRRSTTNMRTPPRNRAAAVCMGESTTARVNSRAQAGDMRTCFFSTGAGAALDRLAIGWLKVADAIDRPDAEAPNPASTSVTMPTAAKHRQVSMVSQLTTVSVLNHGSETVPRENPPPDRPNEAMATRNTTP